MSFKILHIIDVFLPDTMNWLERLLDETKEDCEHHIYAEYYISPLNRKYKFVDAGIASSYPIPLFSKLKARLVHSGISKILLQYIQQHKIQLVHFHFGHVAIKFKNWIQKTELPFCVSLYGFDYEYLVYQNPQVKSEYLLLSKLGGQFIVEGKYSKALIGNYGIPNDKIHIVHMLFEREQQKSIVPYTIPIRLFQAATFTEKKNQLGLINALRDKHASRFIISLYGEQPDKSYFAEVKNAASKQHKHCIRIHDSVELKQYLQLLSQTHYSINLSRRSQLHDTEGGCPVFIKDSLNLAKPAIGTSHCDIPELIANGFNGYLLPENDSSAVSELLDQFLLVTQRQYNQLCMNAAETVKTNIQQNITRQELIHVYQCML